MGTRRGKKKISNKKRNLDEIVITAEEVFSMMDETSQIIAQENATRLSSMGPAASESGMLTDSVEFWSWMNRNYEKSGIFSSSDSMCTYMSGTPGQQNWAKKVVQGKGYEWDWMSAQRRSFKNLLKTFDAGDVANRPGSDITVHDLLTGTDTEQQLKAYTSKNKPHLKNTPKEMTVVTNAEKVEAVRNMGYEDVISFGDNESIQAARNSRLDDMASGKATPNYNIKNVSATVAKAGVVGFAISAGVETVVTYRKWKSGKISTWDYMKEIMKSGGNAGVTSTFSAGIMIPVTVTITTVGVSSLVTIPISFVVSAAVDKVVAPAFARGDYKKILNEANYYTSLIEFCGSLSYTMEIASTQYAGFVSQMVSQQQRFSSLAGNVISQQAIDDFEYYASLPTEEVGVVITGMVSLLSDTDLKFESLKEQNWFHRMVKTVTGKNKATKEDIHRNYEELGVYVSKAVEVLYQRHCIDEKILVIYGEQIIALCKDHISLNARLEEVESWKKSINDSLIVVPPTQVEAKITSVKQLVDDSAIMKYEEAEQLFLAGKLIDAFPVMKEAAENGIGRAYYYLGEYFIYGYGHIKEDSSIALEYWRKGMELGDPLSAYEYGFLKYADDDYQCKLWIRKHIQSVLRLAKENDYAALHVYGIHIVADFDDKKGLEGFFDSVVESLKYFKEAAKNQYWPSAFCFYQATEEIRKSGISMPNYIDVFKNVEWYKAHHVYGMFEVLCGSENYDECAHHFQKALWLRDDKTESAGFLAFLLYAGLVRDSIANGLSSGSFSMYYEAGLKAEDENTLCQVGLLFFVGISKNGIREIEDDGRGKDLEKAYEYLHRSYLIFTDKVNHNQQVVIAMYGLTAGLLGNLCLSGEGIKEDLEGAFNYLTVGHNLGDPQSTYLLALCYKEGLGVKKNEAESQRLMKELKGMPFPGVDQLK